MAVSKRERIKEGKKVKQKTRARLIFLLRKKIELEKDILYQEAMAEYLGKEISYRPERDSKGISDSLLSKAEENKKELDELNKEIKEIRGK
ncbi:hypothetical protein JXB01_01770 [Candidatus Micrarchaeota archaeon]|nr:hypothetical protein [Candidatus Micrarchaeota archaeon]